MCNLMATPSFHRPLRFIYIDISLYIYIYIYICIQGASHTPPRQRPPGAVWGPQGDPRESELGFEDDRIEPRSLLEALEHNFGYPKAACWGVGSPFGASWEVLECPKNAPRAPQGCQKTLQETQKRSQRVPKTIEKTKHFTSEI